ncbi:hypothetical protein ACJX0J_036062, partial [Zea mays]
FQNKMISRFIVFTKYPAVAIPWLAAAEVKINYSIYYIIYIITNLHIPQIKENREKQSVIAGKNRNHLVALKKQAHSHIYRYTMIAKCHNIFLLEQTHYFTQSVRHQMLVLAYVPQDLDGLIFVGELTHDWGTIEGDDKREHFYWVRGSPIALFTRMNHIPLRATGKVKKI